MLRIRYGMKSTVSNCLISIYKIKIVFLYLLVTIWWSLFHFLFIVVVGSSTMSGDCTLQSILDDGEPNEEDESCVTIVDD